jgi:hypothetical protein
MNMPKLTTPAIKVSPDASSKATPALPLLSAEEMEAMELASLDRIFGKKTEVKPAKG